MGMSSGDKRDGHRREANKGHAGCERVEMPVEQTSRLTEQFNGKERLGKLSPRPMSNTASLLFEYQGV